MGCSVTKVDPLVASNREIDKRIKQEKSLREREMKILMLGTAGSGKSTILKQMRIIHLGGFSEDERQKYLYSIIYAIISLTIDLLEGTEATNYDTELYQKLMVANSQKPQELENGDYEEILQDIQFFFESDTGKNLLENLREDAYSLRYFVRKIGEISKKTYMPTANDILHVRVETTGIVETKFEYNKMLFRMVDVGGQKSERRKWFHCFSDVNAVLFVVDISQYNQMSPEDENTNALLQSLAIFEGVCNNAWLQNSSMVLFFNKVDLFTTKISRIPLTVCWPTFEGPYTLQGSLDFIRTQFENSFTKSTNKGHVYSYFTCATDTDKMQYTFDVSITILIRKKLEEAGM